MKGEKLAKNHVIKQMNKFTKYIVAFFILIFIFGYVLNSYPDMIKNVENNQDIYKNQLGLISNMDLYDAVYNSPESNTKLDPQKLSTYVPEKKDPFVAGFLSWLMMGVGQIYCKEYTRGSIFIAIDVIDKGALLAITSYVNKKYSPKGGEIININWSTFDSNTKFLIISYIIAKYGIRFYNVYDAIQSAKNYNKIHYMNIEKNRVSFDVSSNSFQLGYYLMFK